MNPRRCLRGPTSTPQALWERTNHVPAPVPSRSAHTAPWARPGAQDDESASPRLTSVLPGFELSVDEVFSGLRLD